ncbi:MAG: hypothetical protein PHG47_02220 [Sulfuricella sp.]|nr:hypothetical protein [Sulfuricella sp.]
MMEYIFFDEALCARFIEFARQLDVPCQQKPDDMGITVAVPEDLDDGVADSLETHYDQLLEEQADLTGEAEPGQKHAAAICIALADGRPCTIRIEPAIMGRLMGCLSIEEIHELATTIARNVENPNDKPLCHT